MIFSDVSNVSKDLLGHWAARLTFLMTSETAGTLLLETPRIGAGLLSRRGWKRATPRCGRTPSARNWGTIRRDPLHHLKTDFDRIEDMPAASARNENRERRR